ncbi:MAG: hypothetical protein ABEI97_03810 [Candidatus Nanohaloarchaea archaeon]
MEEDVPLDGDDQLYVLADNDECVYMPGTGYGDTGQNMAASDHIHPGDLNGGPTDNPFDPREAFRDRQSFIDYVDRIGEMAADGSLDTSLGPVSHSDQLMYLIHAAVHPSDLDSFRDAAINSQFPEDYGDGFVAVNMRWADQPVQVETVSAGWAAPIKERMADRFAAYDAAEAMPSMTAGTVEPVTTDGTDYLLPRFSGGAHKMERVAASIGQSPYTIPSIAWGEQRRRPGYHGRVTRIHRSGTRQAVVNAVRGGRPGVPCPGLPVRPDRNTATRRHASGRGDGRRRLPHRYSRHVRHRVDR